MDPIYQFLSYVVIAVGAICFLKVFFSVYGVIDRKLHPNKLPNAEEVVFKEMKNQNVTLHLISGEILENHTYLKSVLFDTNEYAANNPIYFQLKNQEGNIVLVTGSQVARMTLQNKS